MRIFDKPWFCVPCIVAISAVASQTINAQPPGPPRTVPSKVGDVPVAKILQRLGAKLEQGAEVRFTAPGEVDSVLLERLRGRAGSARVLEALALVSPDRLGLASLPPDTDLAQAVVITSRETSLACGFLVEAPSLPSLPPTVRRGGRLR